MGFKGLKQRGNEKGRSERGHCLIKLQVLKANITKKVYQTEQRIGTLLDPKSVTKLKKQSITSMFSFDHNKQFW